MQKLRIVLARTLSWILDCVRFRHFSASDMLPIGKWRREKEQWQRRGKGGEEREGSEREEEMVEENEAI